MVYVRRRQDHDSSFKIVPTNVENDDGTAEPYIGAAVVQLAFQLSAPYQYKDFDVYSPTGPTLQCTYCRRGIRMEIAGKQQSQIWDSRFYKNNYVSVSRGVYSNPDHHENRNKLPLRARVEVRYYTGKQYMASPRHSEYGNQWRLVTLQPWNLGFLNRITRVEGCYQ